MALNFNMEYQQDINIEGVYYVLNNVQNLITAEGTLIRRHYISADCKHKKTFDQLIPGTKPVAKPVAKLAPVPVAPVAPTAPAAPAAPAAPDAAAPTAPKAVERPVEKVPAAPKEEKKGFFGKTFGKIKKDRK